MKATPLHWAAEKCKLKQPNLLLTQGAEICAKDTLGRTPLHWAAWNNAADVPVEDSGDTTLADDGEPRSTFTKPKNQEGETPLHYAAWNNAAETTGVLLTQGANINEKDQEGETPLHYAAMGNATETPNCCTQGANINEKDQEGETPLHYAAWNNAAETPKVLLTQGANVNEKDQRARHRCIMPRGTTR